MGIIKTRRTDTVVRSSKNFFKTSEPSQGGTHAFGLYFSWEDNSVLLFNSPPVFLQKLGPRRNYPGVAPGKEVGERREKKLVI